MAFFDKVFVKPNVRGIEQAQLASLLEDELYELRQSRGAETFRKPRRIIWTTGLKTRAAGCENTIPRGRTRPIST